MARIPCFDGVINPLLVRPARKSYEIVCGHRRFAALKHLKEDEAPCRIKEMTDREACRASLAENLAREDLSPLERTEGTSEWIDAYMVGVERVLRSEGWRIVWPRLRGKFERPFTEALERTIQGDEETFLDAILGPAESAK